MDASEVISETYSSLKNLRHRRLYQPWFRCEDSRSDGVCRPRWVVVGTSGTTGAGVAGVNPSLTERTDWGAGCLMF